MADCIFDGCHCDASSSQFIRAHDTVTARRFGCLDHEFVFVFVEGKALGANATLLDELDDFASRYIARVCDVVRAEGDSFFPAGKGRCEHYTMVRVDKALPIGEIVEVEIIGIENEELIAA